MIDKTLRELERNQDSLQYKLLRRRLGFGEVLPTESSPKIFNTTELLIKISKKYEIRCRYIRGFGEGYGDGSGKGYEWGPGNGKAYGFGDGYGHGTGSGFESGHGSGSGSGDGSGFGLGYGVGSGDPKGKGEGNTKRGRK